MLGGNAGLILLVVVVAVLLPTIWGAVRSMGTSQWTAAVALGLVFAPAAIGVYLTFRVLDFPDLTVDASFPAGGAIAATLIVHGASPWLTVPAAALVGAALGIVTALLSVFLRGARTRARNPRATGGRAVSSRRTRHPGDPRRSRRQPLVAR
jgi:hypothetical protein